MNINFNQKRQQLLCDKPGPCAAVVFSGRAPMRSADGAYPFSVDRDFYYLTGSEMLFIEPYDEVQAKWVGGRMKPDEATAISGVQDIRYLDTFESALNLMIRANRGEGETNLWLDLWKHTPEQEPTLAHKLAHKVQQEYPAVRINDLFGDLARMRAIKSVEEIEKMKIAQTTTQHAIEAMMKHSYPGINESELEGAFDFELAKQGVREHAFSSIVAGGARATVLHYSENNQVVNDGELVLIAVRTSTTAPTSPEPSRSTVNSPSARRKSTMLYWQCRTLSSKKPARA